MLIKVLVKTSRGFFFADMKIRNSRSTRGCCCYFGFILWQYDINSYQCVLASSGYCYYLFLQDTMAALGDDGPSAPFDFKFPFQNKSVLIKSNLINEMTNQLGQQMKNKM